jgi:Arc/MetJ-type ribon-helix-helix transcriptional regulator
MSQLINLKFQEQLLEEVDDEVEKGLYASRAEFIRDAVRRLILELREQKALEMLEKNFGKGKGKTPVLTKEMRKKIYEDYLKNRS